MDNAWFYEGNGQSVGPVDLDELLAYLSKRAEWRQTLVWQEGFGDWVQVGEVPEISRLLIKPPPLPTTGPKPALVYETSRALVPPVSAEAKKSPRTLRYLGGIGLFFAAVVGAMIGKPVGHEAAKAVMGAVGPDRATQIDKALSKAEETIRPTLPKKLDEVTTMVAVSHVGSRMRYEYTVELGNTPTPPTLVADVRAQTLPKVCGSTMTKTLGYGVTYEYVYRDAQLKTLGSFLIADADCKVSTGKLQ